MLLPLQTGVSLQKVEVTKILHRTRGEQTHHTLWVSPEKKHSGRITFLMFFFKWSQALSCSIHQTASCYNQVQCNKHVTLNRYYANITFLKYVNLDMNIEWVPLAADIKSKVLPEFSYPSLPLFPTSELYFFWLHGKLTVPGARKIAKLSSKNTQRSFLLYPYDDPRPFWRLEFNDYSMTIRVISSG